VRYSFGKMEIEGRTYTHDLKIIAGRVISDWWRADGHRLVAGDIEDILAARPDVLVVGRGAYGALQVERTLAAELVRRGVELIAEPSAKAVELFNKLDAAGRNVAGAFHLTC